MGKNGSELVPATTEPPTSVATTTPTLQQHHPCVGDCNEREAVELDPSLWSPSIMWPGALVCEEKTPQDPHDLINNDESHCHIVCSLTG